MIGLDPLCLIYSLSLAAILGVKTCLPVDRWPASLNRNAGSQFDEDSITVCNWCDFLQFRFLYSRPSYFDPDPFNSYERRASIYSGALQQPQRDNDQPIFESVRIIELSAFQD